MKIKHENETLTEAIDFDQQSISELEEYIEKLFLYMATNEIRISHIYEKLLKQLSYKELVFLSTQYIVTMFKEKTEKSLEIIIDELNNNFDE